MSTLLDRIERPAFLGPEAGERRDVVVGPEELFGGESTLAEVIAGAWEGLLAHRTAPCPICAGALEPRYGSGHGPVAGRCRDCGTELS